MYKNIIFDLGNVLFDFKPEEYLKKKIKEADRIPRLHRQIFQSEEWQMLDRGTITEEDAIKVIIDRNKEDERFIRLAFDNWYEILTPIEASVNVLKDLKAVGYKLYFLSNFHLLAFEYIIKDYDFFKLFDGGIVSYKEKLLKPEAAIYNRLLEEYELRPEESIFIDDTQVNIDGAKKLKIETILFKNADDLRRKLKDYDLLF